MTVLASLLSGLLFELLVQVRSFNSQLPGGFSNITSVARDRRFYILMLEIGDSLFQRCYRTGRETGHDRLNILGCHRGPLAVDIYPLHEILELTDVSLKSAGSQKLEGIYRQRSWRSAGVIGESREKILGQWTDILFMIA